MDDKFNEITALPRLLQRLEITGCLVTIDAMGCPKEIARAIRDRKADYLLTVKQNQPTLHDALHETFALERAEDWAESPHDIAQTVNGGHGRGGDPAPPV